MTDWWRRKLWIGKKSILIHWKDNRTNQTGIYKTEVDNCNHEANEGRYNGWCTKDCKDPNMFIWEEGNYSCDCNRSIFFLGLDVDNHFNCDEDIFEIIKYEVEN